MRDAQTRAAATGHGEGGLVLARNGDANVYRLPLGSPGKGQVHVGRQVAAFRRQVEAALVEMHGGVSIVMAKRLRTASLALRQSLRISRILADAGEPGSKDVKLTHEQWLAYSDRMLRAEEACDRALTALGLDARPPARDAWDEILNGVAAPVDDVAPAAAEDAQPGPAAPDVGEVAQPEEGGAE